MYQILLVEDDRRIREVISDYFENYSDMQIELQLHAKVKALLNRAKGTILCEELKAGNISLNPRKMEVKVGTQVIKLASKEYLILKLLMENKNMVVSRDTLIVRIWGYDYDGEERILDNHIKKLRQALGEEGKNIKTVVRKGYKLVLRID